MPRLERLTIAMRDEWALITAAAEAGLESAARERADAVIREWGWDRYRLAGSRCGIQMRELALAPRASVYFDTDPAGRMLFLFHPQARDYFTENPHLGRLTFAARDAGSGLLPLDEVLGDEPSSAFVIPDFPADIV